MTNRKWLILAVLMVIVGCAQFVEAQRMAKLPRIGFLQLRHPPTPANPNPLAAAFVQGLRDHGYTDGKNVKLEHRYAEGRSDLLPGLVAEFIQLKVDVIVVASGSAIRVAKQATRTIPIVIVTQDDPVAAKFVDSLARPGGNITGLTRLTSELSGKRLELLKESVPGIARVGILTGNRGERASAAVQDYEVAARAFKVTLQPINLTGSRPDLDAAFHAAVKAGANALIVNHNGLTASYLKPIADLAIKHRLPSMNEDSTYVDAGGLMSYATNDPEQFKRAAYYVDRILKGTKPAELPVEQPTKFEFVVNLKTAKQIGLTIPPNVLVRADRVIR